MTIPVWVLLAFAVWTLLILAATVGVYRWFRILTGRVGFGEYAQYELKGKDWYQRGMRAHANCVENLPIYGAIVLAIVVAGIDTAGLDVLALILIAARICHSLVHVSFRQTDRVVMFRSLFYNTQWICMLAMGVLTALRA
jgi:uncharacterized membrane protein YecN with MAPEG domain